MKCDEETELEIALPEIIEKEQAADLESKENTNTLTKKNENDKASAEESRLKALEPLGQTKRRNADSCDEAIKTKSRRSMGRQMYFYYLEWLFVYNQNKSGYLQITTLQVYYF